MSIENSAEAREIVRRSIIIGTRSKIFDFIVSPIFISGILFK